MTASGEPGYDSLTGLGDRSAALFQHLDQLWRVGNGEPVVAVIIDIDGLINVKISSVTTGVMLSSKRSAGD